MEKLSKDKQVAQSGNNSKSKDTQVAVNSKKRGRSELGDNNEELKQQSTKKIHFQLLNLEDLQQKIRQQASTWQIISYLTSNQDHTIIKPKSNAKFGQSPTDWVFLYDGSVIQKRLLELSNDGYSIVIVTNQGGVEAGHTSINDLKKKFTLIQKELNLPMLFLAATYSDQYRKPATATWEYFLKKYTKDGKIDMKKSFYCGDAAGRPKEGDRKKDFSDTDRKFAVNLGIPFQVPEQTFLGEQVKLPQIKRAVKEEKKGSANAEDGPAEQVDYKGKGQEIILFFGSPGSGKSTFWKNHLSDYVRVNNDTLKTPQKCMAVCEEGLKAGKSVVIDNTNATLEQRTRYLTLAKKYNVSIRCFMFDVTKEVCMHNNTQRKVNSHRQHLSGKIPNIPIHSFFKNSEKPQEKEGYAEIKKIQFKAGPFENEEDKKCYYSLT
ncbi:bifunctional polynucleotide phosphatase kinase-like [Stylonychia lemnae]|uniref:Bifunctional polynucleotide phosphatase kinase-like n=1 Tax=Stylonychia lemnae TaxID=5949 RepID=A0A078A6P9_STYLE|nr:bifunctional polynucleotide phosphatase kinase-like [Stylonychia lemnae]|eukprot:CDW76414.1 bifunctional polynucleotide phosphatase kinase-like [Stylonychia lemnae]